MNHLYAQISREKKEYIYPLILTYIVEIEP